MKNNKQFFFMSGLPRSGGTLLSTILNQNSNIYVSPQSALPNTLGAAYNQYQSLENKDSDQFKNIYNVMEMIIPTYYSHNDQQYIIDRNFSWLDPHPYVILQNHLKNKIKIICPVRGILDILSSWDSLCKKDSDNIYDKQILEIYKDDRLISDKRADYFFNNAGNGGIKYSLVNLQRVLYEEFKDNLFFVEYDDLILNTEKTIDSVYDFLEISKFNHSYKNLSNSHIYNDAWGIKNHHVVKSNISKAAYNYSEVFSDQTIKKYSNLEFWRDSKNYNYKV